ncbi:MAG: EAL domain-containing protein [Burkholderiaceae bacterium]|nr:EAL domain-containing protein [Burkholderiaceae bacterium]
MDSFISTRHDPWIVFASLLVAVFASFVTLDLARRVHRAEAAMARLWWVGGSLAMGTGIWAMHFVGMLGFDAGQPLAYAWRPTLLSWLAAVSAAAVALGIAARERLNALTLAGGACSMAVGIGAMHYTGMAALDLAPGIVWNRPWVVASLLIAVAASAAALALFFMLRPLRGRRRLWLQLGASLAMGAAIGGMHYTAMAAVQLPLGVVCRSLDGLGGQPLALTVAAVTLLLLGGALLLSASDALRQARERRLSLSLQASNRQLQSANAELQQRAFQDPLTGLPNRALFDDRLRHAVARLQRRGAGQASPVVPVGAVGAEHLAVLFVDLDGFKPVNDSLGHAAGDQLLCEVARRLREAARDDDTLARLGGDEFVLLLEGPGAASAATALAERLLEVIRRPFDLGGQPMSLSCSIGIALYPEHDASGQRLLACADAAMYAAKRSGGASCALFEAGMAGDAGEQVQLQQALRHAAERGELMLYYQPKLDAQSLKVHGLEALLRWRHPERGLISPAVFVPLAERFGLINSIGNWVIDEACAQLARWRDGGLDCRVAINLSPHQLRHAELVQRIRDALQRHRLDPSRLVCEITESAMMEHSPAEQQLLAELTAVGVTLSIDDFGTGYSSLSLLRRIPARQLKIDRSFVQDLGVDADARAVLDAVVRLAHALRMQVVAEGVETVAQQQALEALNCDLLQGFLFARPMPADDVQGWLAQQAAQRAAPRVPEAEPA